MNSGNYSKLALVLPALLFTLSSACSNGPSGGSSGNPNTEGDGPVVSPESGENQGSSNNGADTDNPQRLALDTPLAVTLTQGEQRIFEVPTGAEVSVLRSTGNVELLLFDEIEDIDFDNLYRQNTALCRSTGWDVIEDNCRANGSDSDIYAVVDAYHSDSTFTITATGDCSVPAINSWVYRNMQDYYFYAEQVPVVNPGTYDDPASLVRDLRFDELEPFSSIVDAEVRSRLVEEGLSFGFGYDWARDAAGQLRLTQVHSDSPFGRAGFRRGDIAVSLAGESFDSISNERFLELIGNIDNPVSVRWEFIDGTTGQLKSDTLSMQEYRVNTVQSVDVGYTHPEAGGRVAYIALSRFLQTTTAELDAAIEQIGANNPTDLVLDLRYNGGGRSTVLRRFAGQLGGTGLAGRLFTQDRYSSKYTHLNYAEFLEEELPALDLNRLIVLTTGSTASASERLISGLRPYMEVTTIGSLTRGKPFSSRTKLFCGMALSAMETEGTNASNLSIAGGISADCYAADDLSSDFSFGSGRVEGMLDTALNYAFFGTCLTEPQAKTFSKSESTPETYEEFLYGDSY